MIRISVCCIAALMVASSAMADISPDLDSVLKQAQKDDQVPVIVYLPDQVDIAALNSLFNLQKTSLRMRHETVVLALQQNVADHQGGFVEHLNGLKDAGTIDDFTPIWIVNAVILKAKPDVIRDLADREDVGTIYYDYTVGLVEPIEVRGGLGLGGRGGFTQSSAPEPGLVAIRAPEVWAQGYDGTGVLVCTVDTGVDGNHPALASRWAGVADPRYSNNPEWAWFDPVTNTSFPQAFGGHGTHTTGSVCGGLPGNEVGVAPGATWIHAATIDRISISRTISDSILAFQWMLDPDGDPQTNWDVPDVCSNSWGIADFHGVPDCDETFWTFLDANEAAGTVQIFAAGNEGSGGVRRPADRATDDYRTFAVAAVDANNPNWPIAGFSSRGPTFCTPNGAAAIKPDIAGPGVSVRSAWPGGGYINSSGTSMSTPHINGVVALMRQANPNLGVDEIKQIIFDTAVDLGASGEDNSYGWGMVDAFEAVQQALNGALQTVNVDSITAILGTHFEGTIDDADESDDVYVKYRKGNAFSATSPALILECEGVLPTETPSELKIVLECQVNSTLVTQKIFMFNHNTGQFEQVDSRTATHTGDSVAEVTLQGNLNRFVESGTGRVQARITYTGSPNGTNLNWRSRIDQLIWQVQ